MALSGRHLQQMKLAAERRRMFWAKWPKACHTCEAQGGTSHNENGAPHGEGYWPMPVWDACPNCIEKGICPRCGVQHSDEWDGETCAICGWDMDDPATWAPPTYEGPDPCDLDADDEMRLETMRQASDAVRAMLD